MRIPLLRLGFVAALAAALVPAAPAQGPSGPQQGLPACPKGALFTTLPMALSDFRAFRPLGFLQPPIHIFGAKHSSFTINLPGESMSGKLVRFPSNAWVTAIVSTESAQGSGFQLTFYPCRTFKAYFFHLGKLSDALQAAFGASTPNCQVQDFGRETIKKCVAVLSHKVKAGSLVGYSDSFAGVDFGALDYAAKPHAFVNPSRYDFDYRYYVSPVPYFAKKPRAQLEKKLGSWDGTVRRTAEPRVGTLLQDVAGTAQGNWFTPGASFMTTFDFSPFLALVHDYVDPKQPIFSMGNSVKGVRLGLYSFVPRSTGLVNRDFDDVKPDGQVYCYEAFLSGTSVGKLGLGSIDGVLLLSMPSAIQLLVERQGAAGAGCESLRPWALSAGATQFER